MDEITSTQRREAVTRLTSGEDPHVKVRVRTEWDGDEERELSVHPLARMIPLISLADLDRLYDDIQANGVIEPLIMFQGKVLDGRNRLAVASVLGVPVELEEFDGDEAAAKSFVWSTNAARRHLSTPQIALAAERFGFITAAKKEAGPAVIKEDGSMQGGSSAWSRIAAKRVGGITPRTLERFHEAKVPEAPDTASLIDQGKIRRVDVAVKQAVAERSVITGRPIEVPPPIPRTPWDRLGCARGDVAAAERMILTGERGMMSRAQFAQRAREIQAALIRIEWLYRENKVQ